MTSTSSQFSKTSLKNSSVEGPIEYKRQDWTFGRVASGAQRSSMGGFVHENDKKWLYSRRMLDVERDSFSPLVCSQLLQG